MSKKVLPKVVKRRKIKWIRYVFQSVSFVALVLLAPLGILAIPAGICALPISDWLRIDCIFGVIQRILSSPFNITIYLLLVFAAIPVFGSLLFGRVFCGLMCPIGTLLDALGKIKRTNFLKKLRLDNKNNKYAFATGIAVASYISASPLFCSMCPIRGICTTAGPGTIKATELALSTFPLLLEFSEKRAWCKYFCPVGAVIGALGFKKILGFKIDPEKCIKCRACIRVCPTGAISENSLSTGEISRTECIACGRCYDVCMYDAIHFGFLPQKV